jgi:aspartate ammonia-lyase
MRKEIDSIGTLQIPGDAVYGIHSCRAVGNFPITYERINPNLIRAYLIVKSAAALLINTFGHETISKIVLEAHQNNIPSIQALKKKELIYEKELYNLLLKELGLQVERHSKI